MKKALLLAALVLPLPLSAQIRPSLGVGRGVLQTDDLMADAYHVQAGAQLVRISDRVSVRGEALYQQGTANASPLSCEQARQTYCLGRTDEQRMLGGGVQVRIETVELTRGVRPYVVPAGVGVYHLRTDSRESEGCVPMGDLPACAPGPEFSRATSTTSVGWMMGAGLEADVGRMRVFAEFRGHVMLVSGGETGSVPFTVGLSL